MPLERGRPRADLRRRAGDGRRAHVANLGGSVGWRAVRVLNFYSSVFADQLRRGRKTATIRLGDKSHKYRKNDCVLVTIGYQHSPREKIFNAVIDQVEVKRVRDLSPRDIEHDNPEFRRVDEMVHFLEQIYGRKVTMEDTVTVVRFSQIIENPPEGPRPDPRPRRRAELASGLAQVRGKSLWHSSHESAKLALIIAADKL